MWATDTPVLDFFFGFQSQGGFPHLHALSRNRFLRFTSGATAVDFLGWGQALSIHILVHESLADPRGTRDSPSGSKFFHYRPQHSCGKVMFLHMSVILSTGRWQADTLPNRQTHPRQADTPWADTPPPPRDDHCSGRYASYWNAFLFSCSFLAKNLQNNRLAHPLWELAPALENPGSATASISGAQVSSLGSSVLLPHR